MDESPEDEEPRPKFKNILYPSKDNLCADCSRISIPSLTAELASPPSFWRELELENAVPGMSSKYGMRHLDNARDFSKIWETCAMCRLMFIAFTQRRVWAHPSGERIRPLAEKPIFLSPLYTPGTATPKSHNPAEDKTPLMGVLVWMPIDGHPPAEGDQPVIERDGYVPCILLFYTDDESPHTFQRIVGRVPVGGTGNPQTLSRLCYYFTTCRENHPTCLQTVAGQPFSKQEEPILPTYVIDVGRLGPNGEPEPRLTCTDESRGNYVALSYRSPFNKQPFCTTRENIVDHLKCIPWADCPKLFQNAMQMTRDLGMRYIWIDPLCIVQDDRGDEWLSGSKKAARVFESATLVIADSGAWSFDEGLFNSLGSHSSFASSTLVRIPYHDESGVADGTVLYVDYDYGYDPYGYRNDPNETHSSFQGRPWITQEFWMSRRIAFFTFFGFAWSCRSIRVGPNGVQDISTRTLHNRKWSEIIQQHVATMLRQPEDRLLSLEGIRTEIQKRDAGTLYRHGVFEKELQLQLMWRVDYGQAERRKNPLVVPSWSWASSLVKIRFFEPHGTPEPLSSVIQLEDCGKMSFDGDAVVISAGKISKLKKSHWWQKMTVVPKLFTEQRYNWGNTIRYDDAETPGVFSGTLFALLLCTKQLTWPEDRVETQEYFIVLRRICKWNHTYERIGAGMSCNRHQQEFVDNLPMLSLDCKMKSIRII